MTAQHEKFSQFYLVMGAVLGLVAVLMGSAGAHLLNKIISSCNQKSFHTAIDYQFYHAFALCLVGILLQQSESIWLKISGSVFLAGTFLFSGSLYMLALTGKSYWVKLTPVGGMAFIIGWVLLIGALVTMKKVNPK